MQLEDQVLVSDYAKAMCLQETLECNYAIKAISDFLKIVGLMLGHQYSGLPGIVIGLILLILIDHLSKYVATQRTIIKYYY